MTPAERKQELMHASRAMRLEAGAALAALGERADAFNARVQRVRSVLRQPVVWIGVAATAFALLLRRPRARRVAARAAPAAAAGGVFSALLRWGLVGWRVWAALRGPVGRRLL